MSFGMSTLLFIHVMLSLIAVLAGFVVLAGLVKARRIPGWTAFFLATTILTSVTGFGLPSDRLLPSHIFGILSLIALVIAVAALYAFRLNGVWRASYVVTAVLALYLNVFVLVVQIFGKVPGVNTLAPTQSGPPFLIAQMAVLAAFVWFGIVAIRKFRPVG